MSVLLGGVWVVSIQSGAKEEDIETWGECDDLDIGTPCLPDVEETLLHTPQRIEIGSVAMERGTRSESDIHDLSGPNGPTLDSGSTTSPPFRTSPLRHLLSPERTPSTLTSRMRRRRTTYDAGTHTSTRRSPPLLPINTIGTGFQIGLSPVSPGFAIQPRERGRRVSGRGVSEILDGTVEEQLRRRTVSEGDVRKKALALVPGRAVDVENEGDDGNRGQVVTDRGKGKGRESKRRWDWLRRVLN
ncbi:hypothetical protein H0H87_000159 [Tephrocybe sp. NHM501043]|nr:hypothetical protein H0H87_000159 [Tephrocybe sp. NHM501043]